MYQKQDYFVFMADIYDILFDIQLYHLYIAGENMNRKYTSKRSI